MTASMLMTAIVAVATGLTAQAPPNLSGTWVTEFVRTTSGSGLGLELMITQDAKTLTLEYVTAGEKLTRQKLTYKLDGTESKNVITIGGKSTEQASKAAWSGNMLVVTTATAAGEQRRTFNLEGTNLVISTSTSGPIPNKLVYKRRADASPLRSSTRPFSLASREARSPSVFIGRLVSLRRQGAIAVCMG
jgi:hypothetical protein